MKQQDICVFPVLSSSAHVRRSQQSPQNAGLPNAAFLHALWLQHQLPTLLVSSLFPHHPSDTHIYNYSRRPLHTHLSLPLPLSLFSPYLSAAPLIPIYSHSQTLITPVNQREEGERWAHHWQPITTGSDKCIMPYILLGSGRPAPRRLYTILICRW
jgi:hypothetical protein